MGYALAFGTCFGCKKTFGFNPLRVPSINVNGNKEPVCRECIERANPMRKKNGLPEVDIHPEAYEPINEHDL